jgi:hypothetical protein
MILTHISKPSVQETVLVTNTIALVLFAVRIRRSVTQSACGLLNGAFRSSHTCVWMVRWKGCGRKRLLPNLRYAKAFVWRFLVKSRKYRLKGDIQIEA